MTQTMTLEKSSTRATRPMRKRRNNIVAAIMPLIFILWTGCSPLISDYDAVGYKNLTDLKAKTLLFLGKIDPTKLYSEYRLGFEQLELEIEKVYEYEKGKPLNEDTIAQVDEFRSIFSGLMKRYEQNGTISDFYLAEKKIQIKEALNLMIQTESAKPK